MSGMEVAIGWQEVALRLALTTAVGILIGYDRGEHGKAAGMRTTLLVCLAASVSMIQMNLLLPTAGRPDGSFVMNDLMRLPLGILTGVGFIGAGAILRRESIVLGVTTAATLWMVTVIGLCIGGGQIALGLAAAALALFALSALKAIEARLKREVRVRLALTIAKQGPTEAEVRAALRNAAFKIVRRRIGIAPASGERELSFELRHLRSEHPTEPPAIFAELARQPGITRIHWDEPD
jgi:putative Mg2+ transporter-C (MgtC) family protein